MSANDPWTWSMETVIAQLCRSPMHFRAAGCSPIDWPPFAALADKLRAQGINGASLLTDTTDVLLLNSFGISALGQRRALLIVVELLRSRSSMYHEHCATTGVRALSLEGEASHTIRQQHGTDQDNTHVTEDSGRKRRKVHVSAAPLQSEKHGNLQYSKQPAGNEWDYLLSRYQDEDDYLIDDDNEHDIDKDGDSETEHDNSSEGGQIEESDVHPQGQRPNKLSHDQIVDIVNDEIAQITNGWYPGKLGDDDQSSDGDHLDAIAWDAHALWHELRAQNTEERTRVLENTKANIELYGNKVDVLCEGILKSDWRTEAAVRQQCRTLEVMVGWLEQEKWELSVYVMETAPQQIDVTNFQIQEMSEDIAHQPHPRAPIANSTEIIDLGSGSDSDTSESAEEAHQDNHMQDDYLVVNAGPSQHDPSDYVPLDAVMDSPQPVMLSIEPTNDLTHQLVTAANSVHSSQTPSTNTPRKRVPPPISLSPPPPQPSIRRLDSPSEASFATVSKWSWPELTGSRDRKRIVMKVLAEMSPDDLALIRARTTSVSKHDLLAEIPDCVAMLIRDDRKIPGVLPRDLVKIVKFTKLFLSWWLGDDFFKFGKNKGLTRERLETLTKEFKHIEDPETFYNWLVYVLGHTFSEEALRRPGQPSQAEIIVISDDENPASVPSRVRRKRKEKDRGGNDRGGNKANERRKRGRASDTFSAVTLRGGGS
ncbi:hypothetical protein K491DRAFT_777169 [Lophiostoma macrostomum CBS 122681]|uniref:DUF7607 domain-containing protein n=1 Tax=Lophiostoma macrostomum CBS 122681 TaxID=1314788 RepID=A0A6A6TBN8_9PLEO|nr:hypothetical protein K491DRAFT_777169 [Lophiostoma macrostomum CBS 122681]